MLFDDAILIGKIKKCNSAKGNVAVMLTDTAVLENRSKYLILEIDGIRVPFTIENLKAKQPDTVYVRFAEIKNERDSARLIGANVYYPAELIENADRYDVPSLCYFKGFEVYDKQEGRLGIVSDTDDSSMNALLFVRGDKDIIIPFNKDFLVSFNPNKRILRLNLPAGITDIN